MRDESYRDRKLRIVIDTANLIDLVLGSGLYSDKRHGLRELIQNAIDACRVRQELALSVSGPAVYKPEISIILDPDAQTACIKDNGIGMTTDIVRKYLLTIGRSYYASPEFAANQIAYQPIGKFGTGFLACFLLSDKILIRTRHVTESSRNDLEILKHGGLIRHTSVEDTEFHGTEVILDYEQFMSAVGSEEELEEFLRSSFLSYGVDLNLKIRRTETIHITSKVESEHRLAVGTLAAGIRRMRMSGEIDDFVALVRAHMKTLSNRDLMKFDEKHAKVLLVTLLNLGGFYLVQSEVETDNGYIDILLSTPIQHKEAVKFEWLIELKYLTVGHRKQLLRTRQAGLAQLQKYLETRQIRDHLDPSTLRKVLLTFVGKDEVHVDSL